MMSKDKSSKLGEVSGLLGNITKKRESGELAPSPLQSVVQPVSEEKEFKSKNSLTPEHENLEKPKGKGGRPSVKSEEIEYMKISPRIPKSLRQEVGVALSLEKFVDADGKVIKTLDELVTFALEQLRDQKK